MRHSVLLCSISLSKSHWIHKCYSRFCIASICWHWTEDLRIFSNIDSKVIFKVIIFYLQWYFDTANMLSAKGKTLRKSFYWYLIETFLQELLLLKGKPGFAFCFCNKFYSYTVKLVLAILSKHFFSPSRLKILLLILRRWRSRELFSFLFFSFPFSLFSFLLSLFFFHIQDSFRQGEPPGFPIYWENFIELICRLKNNDPSS